MINLTIQNTIQNTIRNTLGDLDVAAFDMLNLFSSGQRGVWYDPSDLATMYQESTGVTAVTADGQPVGLMLDKSRGDVLGDELVTNGNFATDLSSFTSTGGTYIWEAAGQVGRSSVGISDELTQSVSTIIGNSYELAISVDSFTLAPGLIVDGVILKYITNNGVSKLLFKAENTSHSFGLVTLNADIQFSSISVKEVLGTHATQPVATKRPTYKDTPDRLEIDLVDDALLFDVPTGGIDGYMVIGTNDGTASYGVSLPAGSYELGGDYFPSNTINGFLLREGSVSQPDLSKVEKDFVSKGAKASYGDVADFTTYWRNKEITEFPLIDTSSGTNFSNAWYGNNLTGFPLIDTSNGTSFSYAWFDNNLTSFPLIDTSSGTSFNSTWRNNSSLTDFPANMFDNCLCTNFANAFTSTGLTQSSIDGILVSIESNGTSNGTFGQSGGSAPSATGEAAIDAMRSRGWTIIVTGGY